MAKKYEQNWARQKKRNPYWQRLFKGASGRDHQRSQLLRRNMTNAERKLWEELRGKKLGVKFRRQHPIWRYTVDFYCHQKGLVIELDGKVHNEEKEHDANRTAELERMGLRVIRFRNQEVETELPRVLGAIEAIIKDASSA
jgi:very-short-patch-repair endonuclease